MLLFSGAASSLEIDEKLTTRILSVSSTKKTVLLNRGLEDGLVVGDHAKFFLTTGVIARGVVSKASPTRSIWSIYRIINVDAVTVDRVVNIKISSPLKLTDDSSKSLVLEPVPSGNDTISISRGDSRRSRGSNNSMSDEDELGSLKEGPVLDEPVNRPMRNTGGSRSAYIRNLDSQESSFATGRGVFSNKSWEMVGRFQWHSLSTSVDDGVEGSELTTGKESTMGIGIALEKYFPHRRDWLRKLSFYGSFDYSSTTTTSDTTTTELKTSQSNIGLGSNWHFFNDILSFEKPIGFVSGSFGLINSSTTAGDTTTKGSGTFFSIGLGAKYYTSSGFGVRGMLDFYSQGVKSSVTDSDSESVTTKAGPRLIVGMSYLF
ncbi:MAG: hypothetical protein ACJAT2_002808 [Bacteriovoracaceae bacterium]|jgi:hypothetical protein